MTEYQQNALNFLTSCQATMEISFIGKEIPTHWKDETKPHNKYQFTITTPKGKYTSYFYDSLHNTEISEISQNDFARKKYKADYSVLTMHERAVVRNELASLKANAKPTEYDILASLTKESWDSFSDFCSDFSCSTDSISAREAFLACGEEYAGIRHIFTEEQMKKLREIW